MKKLSVWYLLLIACLSWGCTSNPEPGGTAEAVNQTTPTAASAAVDALVSDPGSPVFKNSEQLMVKIPRCQGIRSLGEPIEFKWPNVNRLIGELRDSSWGYYACDEAPATVAAFYRKEMPKPPYNMIETAWIDRTEGSLGLYNHVGYLSWFYIWIVSQDTSGTSSYIILSQSDSAEFYPGECRLDQPVQGIALNINTLIPAPPSCPLVLTSRMDSAYDLPG